MILHGWCQRCHKIKMVRVSILRRGAMQIGVCRDCEAKR